MKRIKGLIFAAVLAMLPQICANASIGEQELDKIKMGSFREEIHYNLGKPFDTSKNRLKEKYILTNGKYAVLLYNPYGYLSCGFIVQ